MEHAVTDTLDTGSAGHWTGSATGHSRQWHNCDGRRAVGGAGL